MGLIDGGGFIISTLKIISKARYDFQECIPIKIAFFAYICFPFFITNFLFLKSVIL